MRDALTGAYSRAYLKDRLREEVARSRRYDIPITLLLVDLDHFKSINDAFGHTRGDEVLVELVRRLTFTIRSSDLIFRYGGDEFVLLLPNTSDEEGQALAQRLLDTIRAAQFEGEPPLSLSLSIGLSSFPDAPDPETLFETADRRLMEAKRRGRGQVVEADPPGSVHSLFKEASRLVEREIELEAGHQFLESISAHNRGVLRVVGPAGSGRSRFLAELVKSARLRGYEVLLLRARSALRSRAYGALTESQFEWEGAPLAAHRIESFLRALPTLLVEQARRGLLIAVDDFPELDPDTLSFIRLLLASSEIPHKALAYASDARGSPDLSILDSPLLETIELRPLSLAGTRVWVRELLQGEPEDTFLAWLHQEARGLPALVFRGLTYLVEQRVLEKGAGGWAFRRSFSSIQLAKELAELLRPPPSNLPDLPYCVGRDGEIQTAKELLRERRLLTIVGPGGIGKTHLALQVAAEQAEHYRHGAFFVSLAPLAEAEFIVTAVAEALQFSFSGADDHQSQLLDYLRAKQMLLVMDGFERLLEGVGVVNQILETAPGMAIIVTSLERLNLEGEAVLEIPGMALPEGETLTDLESYSAFQLFVRSAQRVWSAFSTRPEDLPHIVRICRLVEGMPLGIELAAAWVRMLSCRDIADQVEASLGFLATHAAAPDGQRSMRAVFDYFWGLLSEAERSILRKLSVFRGGFHKEAAQEVTGASLFFLSALVDKALLRRNASGRYSMHEVLRQYAEEELDRSRGERALAQDLHSEVYASFLAQQEPQLRGGRQRRALEDISAEIENVRAAWRWAVHRGRAESLLRSLNSLFRFYEVRSWFREGEETFRWAIETMSAERAEWRGTAADRELLLARLASFRASLLISLSLHDEGRQLLWDCLPVFRRLDSPVDEATALNRLGELARMVGEYDEARNYLEQALDGYRRSEDREGIAKSLFNLGVVAGMVGDFPRAKGLFQESLDLRVDSGDEHGVARCLNALGNISAMLGERPEARRLYEESLVLSKRVGDRWSMANCLNNLGVVAQEMGEHQAAIELCRESLAIYTEIGNRYGLALSLIILGGSSLALGEWMEGRDYLFQALRTAVEVQALPVSLEAMLEIATSMEMEGDLGRALEIVTLVMSHPAIDKDSASKAERIRERLRSSMAQQDFEAAQARGRQVTFDGVVAALLRQEALAAPSM